MVSGSRTGSSFPLPSPHPPILISLSLAHLFLPLQVLVEPYAYLASIPGKEVRSALIAAFNQWMGCVDEDLEVVKKVVGMLHTASLLSVPFPSFSLTLR